MSTPAAEAFAKTRKHYPAPTTTQLGTRELTHADRCDVCGHAAWVRTESNYSTLQLTWCAHHYGEVEHHFSAATHTITDERAFLRKAVKAQAEIDTTNWGKK